jgi:putative transposase
MARAVCPGTPHHITQRGVRRFDVFRDGADYERYVELLLNYAPRFGLGILAYCLMTNHVHLVVIPETEDSIAKAVHRCHGIYASEFNKKYGKTGHLWQARFFSCVLDAAHTRAAVRYVERNPVRAGMVIRGEEYRWSSADAHCGLRDDPLLQSDCLLEEITDWSEWLAGDNNVEQEKRLRSRTCTGRPCGDEDFLKRIESVVGRPLGPRKPGPKPKGPQAEEGLLWRKDETGL